MKISNVGNDISIQNLANNTSKVNTDDFERKLQSALNSKDEEQIRKSSQEIESIFANMMLKEMRKSIDKSDLVESAPGSEIWESMFDEKIAEEISKGRGLGLSEMIYKQLTKDLKNTYKITE